MRHKKLISNSSEKLGAAKVHRSHAFEGVAESPKSVTLLVPFWDWKGTMSALALEFNGATSDYHEYIINGNSSA